MKYFLIFFIVISCNAQKKSNQKNTSDNELRFLLSDNYSGVKQPKILIIKEATSLKKFFLQINKTKKPGLALPKIDFNKETVVIYCEGESFLTYNSSIEKTKETARDIVLKLVDVNSYENIDLTLISPFYLYSIENSGKKIHIVK
ncbi:hypothetical protein KO500_09780 [Cellulophaga baltica]|uniref:hypothetical protein n=1 Tax=Cellulophaga TaxID=104264 RepID=UPI001C0690B0|nr:MULTISPECIES: hypothetical protein [Cellulophaga]MBU2996726.1 hypothetical protein [Cellulophaga baltica]MDO6768120.1 hypothetical protein [Cellulophaga sp. 1_MG-2023]